jgi:AAA15 family ATPase/GTPase
VYGSNAAGKTNFLLAVSYVRRAISFSQTSWKRGSGTRFDCNSANSDKRGFFEVVFQLSEVTYRYGFTVKLSHFVSEWLFSYPKGRERMLFKRVLTKLNQPNDEENYFEGEYMLQTGPSFSGDKREHESSFRRTRENSLFLSAAAQDNQSECVAIEDWFRRGMITEIKLNVSALDQGMTSILAAKHKAFKTLLLPLLKAADPCISDIQIVKKEKEADEEAPATFKKEAKAYKVSFVVNLAGKRIEVPFERQSRDIKRIYALSAVLVTALKFGRVCIVDELETSMHPHVASQLLALFQNSSSNPNGAQLVFTTYETRLLNL